MTLFMVLSSWPKTLREFTRFIWWMQTQRQVTANPQTKPVDLGCESAENWQLSSTSTIAIVIITQLVPRRVEGWVNLSWLSGGVLAWLSVWSEVQTCIWPSWCHCHSLSLASVKSRLVLPFWYRLTWVVPEKGPLNGCNYMIPQTSTVTSNISASTFQFFCFTIFSCRPRAVD